MYGERLGDGVEYHLMRHLVSSESLYVSWNDMCYGMTRVSVCYGMRRVSRRELGMSKSVALHLEICNDMCYGMRRVSDVSKSHRETRVIR